MPAGMGTQVFEQSVATCCLVAVCCAATAACCGVKTGPARVLGRLKRLIGSLQGDGVIVIGFRGTASMANVLADIKVRCWLIAPLISDKLSCIHTYAGSILQVPPCLIARVSRHSIWITL